MSQIKKDMLNGVFWSAIEKYSGIVVSVIISMILARVLSPEEFGIVAIVVILITFLQIFCTLGIGPAVIQRQDLKESDYNSIYTFSLYSGLVLALILFVSSWPISLFYGDALLVPTCQILSIDLFFAAANMVPNALMLKDKKFKEIARRTLVLQISSGILSVIAAICGAGIYALIFPSVFTSVGIFVWNRRYYHVSFLRNIEWDPLKKIYSFAFYQFLFEVVNYFSRNLDKLIIGKMLNMEALGIYEKSYGLVQRPFSMIINVLDPVMLPVLKDLQNEKEELTIKYNKIIRFVSTISFPLGIILYGCATEIIIVLFGSQWEASISVFKILSLSIPLMIVFSTSGAIYLICNNTKMQFWLGIRNTITTISGFLIAAYFFKTIDAMAWAWVITLYLNFAFTFLLLYHRVLLSPIMPMLSQMLRPFFISLILVAFFIMFDSVKIQVNIILMLLLKLILSCAITLLGIQYLKQFDLITFLKSHRDIKSFF